MNTFPNNSTLRISIGYFKKEQMEEVERMLNSKFKKSLVPAIQRLKGNLAYYVAIDKEKNAFTNVSLWRRKEDALQMSSLKEMIQMRYAFEELGITFIEITNHDLLWSLNDSSYSRL